MIELQYDDGVQLHTIAIAESIDALEAMFPEFIGEEGYEVASENFRYKF